MPDLLFVYGTLKEGFFNHAVNQGRRVPGEFETVEAFPLYLVGARCVPWMVDAPGQGQPRVGDVEFDLAAADVVHSFWVPEFLFKRDVMPYPEANHSQSRFQVTNLTEGSYVGRCAEMGGTYHSMMNFEVRVVSPDKFARYIVARQSGKSNAEALVAIGGSPVATVTHPFDTRRGEQVVDPETKK